MRLHRRAELSRAAIFNRGRFWPRIAIGRVSAERGDYVSDDGRPVVADASRSDAGQAGRADGGLDVKIAQARVRQARAELAYAAGGQYPDVNADAGYSYNQSLPQALEGLGKSQYQGAGFPPPRLHQADVAKAMHCLILFQDGL
jgi:hypothetical protein